nr:aminopeptidase P family protein [Propionibacterium sp.]
MLTWAPAPADHGARLRVLAEAARAAGVDAVVLAPGADLRYYLGHDQGSHERLTALVVRPDGDPLLLVPALERPGWDATITALGLAVRSWADGEDAHALLARALPRGARLAVDDHLPARHLLALQRAAAPADIGLAGALTAPQRACKDADEAAALTAIAAANDRVQAAITRWLRPGRTEAEVAADIAAALVAEGHARADFVIVASGPNGAAPHHSASDRVIRAGDPVVVDIGGPAASGYNSDSTRTYCLGEPNDPEFAHVHAVVCAAQEAGVGAAVVGATCESVDAAARAVVVEAGYGEHFITRTGHGIGLEVHEPPYLVRGNTDPLAPGQCFSVEPGIYLPGRFGVRVEDIVLLGADGRPRRLNDSPRGWRP